MFAQEQLGDAKSPDASDEFLFILEGVLKVQKRKVVSPAPV